MIHYRHIHLKAFIIERSKQIIDGRQRVSSFRFFFVNVPLLVDVLRVSPRGGSDNEPCGVREGCKTLSQKRDEGSTRKGSWRMGES